MFDIKGQLIPELEIEELKITIPLPKKKYIQRGGEIFMLAQKILSNTAFESEINIFYGYLSDVFKLPKKQLIKDYDIDTLIIALVRLFELANETEGKYTLPYFPSEESEEEGYSYEVYTGSDKIVADYAKLSIIEVNNLNYVDFLILRKDAYINKMSQTEKGRDYLEQCYCFESEKPDRAALRKQFGGEKYGK